MNEVRIALVGMGRMGQALAALAPAHGCRVVAEIDRSHGPAHAVTRETLRDAQVAIDFTTPDAAPDNIRACLLAECPIVVGTTGWYDQLHPLPEQSIPARPTTLPPPTFSLAAPP